MKQTRESNYDLLRIICTIAVIMIHVSSTYKTAITSDSIFGQLYEEHIVSVLLYNTLSRFAVPCFFMLSGAFLLADDRNAEYKYFYKKCMRSVGIPTMIFSVLYFLYSEALACVKIAAMGGDMFTELLFPVRAVLEGAPFYHMWYLYTLMGLYFLTPVILRLKNEIGEAAFLKLSVVLFPVCCISGWTTTFTVHWGIGKVACHIGYLVMGYQIRRYYLEKKNNKTGVLFIAAGIAAELVLTYIQYGHSLAGLAEADERYSLVDNFNPLVVLAAVLIFAGFSCLTNKRNLSRISGRTFYIYLFHAGVWSLLSQAVRSICGITGDARVIIPISVVIVFGLSYVLSVIYLRIWEKIERRQSVRKKNLFFIDKY